MSKIKCQQCGNVARFNQQTVEHVYAIDYQDDEIQYDEIKSWGINEEEALFLCNDCWCKYHSYDRKSFGPDEQYVLPQTPPEQSSGTNTGI